VNVVAAALNLFINWDHFIILRSSIFNSEFSGVRLRKSLLAVLMENGTDGKCEKKFFPIFAKRFKPEVNPLREMIDKVNGSSNKSSPRRKPRLIGKKETPGKYCTIACRICGWCAIVFITCDIVIGLTQLVLDAGQKKIGPRFCDECGMLYSPGEPEDEELHRQAHVRLESVHSITVLIYLNTQALTRRVIYDLIKFRCGTTLEFFKILSMVG
jgi:hypothetical protein